MKPTIGTIRKFKVPTDELFERVIVGWGLEEEDA